MNLLKSLASRLPSTWQWELKRLNYRRQIRRDAFKTSEPEFAILDQLISDGDWVIDVGANVGHYSKRFSELVGSQGRVIAFEPVPETFALLAVNAMSFQHHNLTLLNLAASDRITVLGMQIPSFDSGLKDYYEASLTARESELKVMTVALDLIASDHPVRLIKIDAENHDPIVLNGLEQLLARDHPTLIIETSSADAIGKLEKMGYSHERLARSPNKLFRWQPPRGGPSL